MRGVRKGEIESSEGCVRTDPPLVRLKEMPAARLGLAITVGVGLPPFS